MSKGRLEVITGCMFSGKTEELIRRVRRLEIAKQRVLIFKPELEIRYGALYIGTSSGNKKEATAIPSDDPFQIVERVSNAFPFWVMSNVAIDEAQFFSNKLIDAIKKLLEENHRVVVTGLDLDFRGEPFGPMPQLMALADEVIKLTAICTVCHLTANRTQRIINGQPAPYDSELVVVSAD
jgi:thymidine kinase